jgi:hypothetical protein
MVPNWFFILGTYAFELLTVFRFTIVIPRRRLMLLFYLKNALKSSGQIADGISRIKLL